MKDPIHDNHLISYNIDCCKREIVLHTVFPTLEQPQEFTDVVFSGVHAYYFKGDNFNTIFLWIMEIPPEKILQDNKDLFESEQNFCWPGPWNTSPESVLEYIREHQLKGYEITPAFGMGGWVWAKSMQLVPVNPG
jgi:hypothetical protein